MRFGIAGEGLTDFIVLKNLLIGFFNNPRLLVDPLRPKDEKPFGWPNLLNYLTTDDFKTDVLNLETIIIQIDTKESDQWILPMQNIGDREERIQEFVQAVGTFLINKIGEPFYLENQAKIIFAITVHDLECWLLPFIDTISNQPQKQKKMVSCVKTLETIASELGFSIHQKMRDDGRHYDDFSKPMKKQKELFEKSKLNPSLNIFIETLIDRFPPPF